MSLMHPRIIASAVLFLFTLLSGLWLSSAGKPYNGLIFNLHKLIALAAVILIGISLYHLYQAGDLHAAVVIGAIAVTGLLFVTLFATGAMLSIGSPGQTAFLRIHQAAPLLALGSSLLALYLLASASLPAR